MLIIKLDKLYPILVMISITMLLSLPMISGYFIVDHSESKNLKYEFDLSKYKQQYNNYSLNYTNTTVENITEVSFDYRFNKINLSSTTERFDDRTNSDEIKDIYDYEYDRESNQTEITLECAQGNNYDNLKFTNWTGGTFNNTYSDNGTLRVKSGFSEGTWLSSWYNYSTNRTLDYYTTDGNYTQLEYRTSDTDAFINAGSSEEEGITSVPSGTTSDAWQFRFTLNIGSNKLNNSYTFQIIDDTQLFKVDKSDGSVLTSTSEPDTINDFDVGKKYVFVADSYDLNAYWKTNLSLKWSNEYGNLYGMDSVATGRDYVYSTAENENEMYKTYKSNGTQVTKTSGDFGTSTRLLDVNSRYIFAGNPSDQVVRAYNKYDLSTYATVTVSGPNDLSAEYNTTYVYTIDRATKEVRRVNVATNTVVWTTTLSTSNDNLGVVKYLETVQRTQASGVVVSNQTGHIWELDTDGNIVRQHSNKDKNFYMENDRIYYAKNNDGFYSDNLTLDSQRYYNSRLGTYQQTKGYVDYYNNVQEVKSFNLTWKNTIGLKVIGKNRSGATVYKDWHHLEYLETVQNTVNKNMSRINLDGDFIDAQVDYDYVATYSARPVSSISTDYKFNTSNETYYSETRDNFADSNSSFSFDTKNIDYVYISNNEYNKSANVSAEITITYLVYRQSEANDLLEVMTSVSFFSLLLLTIITVVTTAKTQVAILPVAVFVIGSFTLSYMELLSWTITLIIAFSFIAFYIAYSSRWQQKM